MEAELSTAFTLLGTGMITVFVVLLLVYITGNTLTRFVNAYFPEIPASGGKDQIDKKKIAAINAAVEIFTKGTGRVTKIEKKK